MIIDFIINVYGNTFIEILVTKHCLGLFKCILCLGIMAELSCIVLVHLIITVGHTFWGKSDTKVHFHEQKDMLPSHISCTKENISYGYYPSKGIVN